MDNQRPVAVEEKGRRFVVRVNNRDAVFIQQIDDAGSIRDNPKSIPRLLQREGGLCDYCIMVYPKNKHYFFLIELKGKKVKHGVEQLENTIRQIRKVYEDYPKKEAYIIAKGFPGPISTEYQNKKQEFKMSFGFDLVVRTGNYERPPLEC